VRGAASAYVAKMQRPIGLSAAGWTIASHEIPSLPSSNLDRIKPQILSCHCEVMHRLFDPI
jgi:hypothetical protein